MGYGKKKPKGKGKGRDSKTGSDNRFLVLEGMPSASVDGGSPWSEGWEDSACHVGGWPPTCMQE